MSSDPCEGCSGDCSTCGNNSPRTDDTHTKPAPEPKYHDPNIVSRKDYAERLRSLANDVENIDGDIRSADPDLRDTLLGMVDSLYCKSFPDEDPDFEVDDEE